MLYPLIFILGLPFLFRDEIILPGHKYILFFLYLMDFILYLSTSVKNVSLLLKVSLLWLYFSTQSVSGIYDNLLDFTIGCVAHP